MLSIEWLWYQLTAYLPRLLPTTPEQYERLKHVLIHAYGVPDEPPVWILVSGQISSVPAQKIRLAWGLIANAAKRMQINQFMRECSKPARRAIEEKLMAEMLAQSELLAKEQNDQKNAEVQPITDESQEPEADQFSAQEGGIPQAPDGLGIGHNS